MTDTAFKQITPISREHTRTISRSSGIRRSGNLVSKKDAVARLEDKINRRVRAAGAPADLQAQGAPSKEEDEKAL